MRPKNMGLEKNTTLIKGIRISENILKDFGFDGVFDDKLMPCIEGDSEISLYYGEGSDYVFLGMQIAQSGKYDHKSVKIKIPDKIKVRNELIKLGFSIDIKDINIWFFDYYS